VLEGQATTPAFSDLGLWTHPNFLVAQTHPAVKFAVAFSPPAAGGFFVLTIRNHRENF
jgi:hypothetical protein